MALTPQDLQAIAGLVQAQQYGFLPPNLLAEQLHWVRTITQVAGPPVQVVQANANRVYLAFESDVQTVYQADPPDAAFNAGLVSDGGKGGRVVLTTWADGVLPQLGYWVVTGGNDLVITELIWVPPVTGLGHV